MANLSSKKTRKTVSLIATLTLCFSALGGIGWGIYNITQSLKHSNDFSAGRSIELNLQLYKVNSQGFPIDKNGKVVTDDQDLVPIYNTIDEQQKQINDSASALTNILQKKNLTNIKVSSGYSNVSNDKFPNKVEKVGVLYATFENSEKAFSLNDVTNQDNNYANNKKIFDSLNDTYNLEIDLVNDSYQGSAYKIPAGKSSTGRKTGDLAGIYFDETTKQANGTNFNMYTGQDTEGQFEVSTNKKMNDTATIKSKKDFNTWTFVEQKNAYDKLAPPTIDTPPPAAYNHYYNNQQWYTAAPIAEPPTAQQTFQTEYTWLLWKDKQGLLNYLNSLIVIWYYNLYANVPNVNVGSDTSFGPDNLDQIFNVNDFNYNNYVDPDTRKQINNLIKELSTTEKSFIAMLAHRTSGSTNPETWRPELITEEDLIPVLYMFYNDKIWNSSYQDVTADNIPSYGYSKSVQNGWGWLESSNPDPLRSLVGDYLIGTIDYKSFQQYFFNPKTTDQTTTPIDPFVTKEFYFKQPERFNPKQFCELANKSINFPIVTPLQNSFMDKQLEIQKGKEFLQNEFKNLPIDNPDDPAWTTFRDNRKAFANKFFGSANIFTEQNSSKPLYDGSFVTNVLSPLDLLMIVLGAILFIIGIFISIRYRIPGVVAFIISSFVFVMSAVLYNVFGFTFSFYSFIALSFGSFLSLLSPMFLCRNTLKEVRENSTISASLVKSVKKYWKTSLDFHIISILCSLSFLFFGIGGNINFGSMLIISVFLSLLLSGVLFFVLMIMYTQYTQTHTYNWFLSKKYNGKLMVFHNEPVEPKYKQWWIYSVWSKFSYNIDLTSKSAYISLITFIIIAVAGVFVLGFVGSVFSLDFKDTNILIFKNFSDFNLGTNEIITYLNINAIQSYVYNNELFIYTTQTLNINEITTQLKHLDPNVANVINNNLLTTTMTTDISVQIVLNTFQCIGIGMGLSAVWAMLSLNIVAVIPLAVTQIAPVFILAGFFGTIQFPLQLEITLMVSVIFMITSVMATASLSSLKASWNREIEIDKNELKTLFNNILSKINLNFMMFIAMFIVLSLLSMMLSSISLILIFLSFIIMLCWISFYVNRILVYLWYQCILLRSMFNKEILLHKGHTNIQINYDFVDEQLINGINK